MLSTVDCGFVPKASDSDFDIALDSVELPGAQKASLRKAGINFTNATISSCRMKKVTCKTSDFSAANLSASDLVI